MISASLIVNGACISMSKRAKGRMEYPGALTPLNVPGIGLAFPGFGRGFIGASLEVLAHGRFEMTELPRPF